MSKRITFTLPDSKRSMQFIRNRGSFVRSIRLYKDELSTIESACNLLGISPNYFIRISSYYAAKGIIRRKMNKRMRE